MSVINTNITSMIGQQNLNASKSALTTSMERLSSGLRINSAKDDAAGQAIANRMSAQISGLAQAQRNANDGISIAQTAEGGLNQINDNLQRVRELTVQAQNDTNSASDIDSIQQEVNERMAEIERIANETDFNGTKILSKTGDTEISIQVGSEDNQKIGIEIKGNSSWNFADNVGTLNAGGFAQVNGESRSVDANGFDVLSKTATTTTATAEITALAATAEYTTIDSAYTGTAQVVSYTDLEGNTAYAITSDNAADTAAYNLEFDADGNATIGGVLGGAEDVLARSSTTTIANGDNVTSYGESNALDTLDTALKAVDEQRSQLGAVQNRFESAITNLQTNETNLSAARSRIEDADYATEVANMTRAQILQQAGTSVLAQANQIPQSVLSLLG
ncbi:FliC/FljB family flagellin [Halomonas sp. DP8Y7-1]|uniref:FliC/FljB family flagellin n=1 Tax=Halomonas sp. DP8Y7-1 TaxID=2859078 RepID=UPI001C94D132|nr:FliC/FljB family flagellin [Halomonas sp. DP8Y7-1]MBY6031060.1 FliC/FljB family flagellin [Halomonas sp. DP8Y7-1]MED5295255.1 FliC/FljB family flagellin [Pseudomonadota bacterium]